MASEIKAPSRADDGAASGKDATETAPDTPLLDLSDAAVKKMIKGAKKRGYVTYEQINAVLPSEEVKSAHAALTPDTTWSVFGIHHAYLRIMGGS